MITEQKACNITKPSQSHHGPSLQWHMSSTKPGTIFTHSAFFDDRPNGGLPSLKILSVSDFPKTEKIYCYIWYSNVNTPLVLTASRISMKGWKRTIPKELYKMVESNGRFAEYVFLCQLPSKSDIPVNVSVNTRHCEVPKITMPIIVPKKPKVKLDCGLCVAISFGKIDLSLLVEWFEIHKLLGVKQFNVYNASMNVQMQRVFNYYMSKDDLKLHHMDPVIPSSNLATILFSSLASLNHCLLTNMYTYEYIVVVDFDEVIVPKDHVSYPQLLTILNEYHGSNHNWISYTFRNVYFFNDVPPDATLPLYLPKTSHNMRNASSPQRYVPKSFIHPLNCEVLSNHYCLKGFKGSKTPSATYVSPDIARSHHYRKCGFPETLPYHGKCSEYKALLIKDDIMLRYLKYLDTNVSTTLAHLNVIK